VSLESLQSTNVTMTLSFTDMDVIEEATEEGLDADADLEGSQAERQKLQHLSERFNITIPDNLDEQVIEGVLEAFEGDQEFSGTRAREDQDFSFFNQSSTEVKARIKYIKPLGEITIEFNRNMSFPDDFASILNYWSLPREVRESLSESSEMEDATRRLLTEEIDPVLEV